MFENSEVFRVSLTGVDSDLNFSPASATVTIIDSNCKSSSRSIALIDCAQCLFTAVTVSLQQQSYVFNEADGSSSVCAQSSGASNIPFTVRFSTVDVTAQGKVVKVH